MTTSAPKRYAHALIRHFIIIALFFPTFYSQFHHVYYQDFSFISAVALLFALNIFLKWNLDINRNRLATITIISALILYNIIAYYNYHHYSVYFWQSEPINVTISFLFFLSLLLIRDYKIVISEKVIRFTIVSILINNFIAIIFRLTGGGRFYMYHLSYDYKSIADMNNTFSWIYYDASEYALILILSMAFFIVYKKHFKNYYLYIVAQGILILCMIFTNTSTYYLATVILFVGELIHYLIKRLRILSCYVYYSIPVALFFFVLVGMFLFKQLDSFQLKAQIWKGTWDTLKIVPEGLYVAFSYVAYEVPGVDVPLSQAHNTFLNHMLRHSIGTGIAFLLLIASLWIIAFLKKPNYRSLGILLALLIPMNMEFGLQTLHLPIILFMIYCIFFHTDTNSLEGGV